MDVYAAGIGGKAGPHSPGRSVLLPCAASGEIPKPEGGVGQLGIQTAIDRLIQQAMDQVLPPVFDPDLIENQFITD
jgi:hypothetical protein